MFNETQETIDTYLQHFERLARIHGVSQDYWATVVSAFLQGNAKAVYSSLDPSEWENYEKLKEALLKHYCLNKEAYLKRFRKTVKRNTETHGQFHTRVKSLFEMWYRMTGAAQAYQDLRDVNGTGFLVHTRKTWLFSCRNINIKI